MVSLLEQRLAEHPIVLPRSPFWEVFKRFGRDEIVALAINVVGTGGLELLINNGMLEHVTGPLGKKAEQLLLAVVGPAAEKFGFYPPHFKGAWDEYRHTPAEKREPISAYMKHAVKGGSTSAAEDLLIHDPLYVGLLYAGMQMHPETPVWLLSVIGFAASVVAVAGVEVGVNELRYLNYQQHLRQAGFHRESYNDARFFIRDTQHQAELLQALQEEFRLPPPVRGEYHDRYFPTRLPHYSGREPVVRLRKRTTESGEERTKQSAQIVYSRTAEIRTKGADQFRYFVRRRDKLYLPVEGEMPSDVADFSGMSRTVLAASVADGSPRDVHFARTVVYDPKGLFVTIDAVQNGKQPFYVLELKAYRGMEGLLRRAMRYVMQEFPLLETTHDKSALVGMDSGLC